MSKLFTLASVNGASLSGANLKATLVALYNALSSVGVTDASRTTVTASATLLTTQCGILLVDCSAGSVTLTLPSSGTTTDEAEYQIRRIDTTYANTLTVQRGGADTIEGSTSAITIGCGGDVTLKMPGGSTNWRATGRGGATTLAARESLGVPGVNWLDNPDGEIYQIAVAATADDVYMEDCWYALTQTGTITPSQQTAPEDGFAFGMRITQSQASAQRMGEAQILEMKRTKKLRGKTATFGGRFKLSTSANLRVAILAWTGTENTVTSDVVNDWTSSNYTAGNFFLASNLTVVAVGSAAMTSATARDVSVTGTIPSNAANLIVMYWTEATAAQNVTLDAWGRRLVEGATLGDYIRRSEEEELARCQRFFCKSWPTDVAVGTNTTSGVYRFQLNGVGANAHIGHVSFPVQMLAVPSMTGYTQTGVSGSFTWNATTVSASFSDIGTSGASLAWTGGGTAADTSAAAHWTANSRL